MSASKQMQFMISDYEVLNEIGRGATSIVYDGLRNGQHYAIKLMNKAEGNRGVSAGLNFRKEAAALAKVSHPTLVKVVEVGEFEGRGYVVMELIVGEELGKKLKKGLLTEEETTQYGIRISEGLAQVHRHGMIHRDIKPDNVLICENGDLKIIDFGFAMSRDLSGVASTDAVGTLLYCSPEQMQHHQQVTDGRSDLYSLGALLYHCLTGRPPFVATDPAELVNKLLNEAAANPCELRPELRPVLGLIVQKLLEKSPDRRYQTAQGLVADLSCLPALESDLHKGTLHLDAHDGWKRVSYDVPLVGRDAELELLRSGVQKAAAGRGCLIQVEGEGGSGKTRLTQEILSSNEAQHFLVLKGKCQQAEVSPLGVLRQALDEYVLRINNKPEEERKTEIEKIRQAAGDGSAVLKRVSRGMAQIFEDVPDAKVGDPRTERERLFNCIANLFLGLARGPKGLLLLIDDTQWLDSASLQVLKRMSESLPTSRILILTTARNDHESLPAAEMFVNELAVCRPKRVTLEPLGTTALEKYIGIFLGGRTLELEIVERLAHVTHGNVFAVREYVLSMLDSGMLSPTEFGWSVNLDAFTQLTVSSNVLQMVVNRISSLSPTSLKIFNVAAILGMRFDPSVLSDVCRLGTAAVARAIDEGTRANLVEKVDEDHFGFVHDRVSEALLQNQTEEEKTDTHQAIAEVLDARPLNTTEHIYAVANHFSKGRIEKNPQRAFEVIYRAGQTALESYVNETAFILLQRAQQIAGIHKISPQSMMVLNESLGLACYRSSKMNEAVQYFRSALALAENRNDKARFYTNLCWALDALSRYDSTPEEVGAWDCFASACAVMGVSYPRSPAFETLSLLWHWGLALFFVKTGFFFGKATGTERERRQIIAKIYEIGISMALRVERQRTMLHLSILTLYNSHRLGVSPENSMARSSYGWLLSFVGFDRESRKFGQQAISMAEQLGDTNHVILGKLFYALSLGMLNHFDEYDEAFAKVFVELRKYLPGHRVTVSCPTGHMNFLNIRGNSRNLVDFANDQMTTLAKFGNFQFLFASKVFVYANLGLMGRHEEANKSHTELLNLAATSIYDTGPHLVWAELLIKREAGDIFTQEVEDKVSILANADWKTPLIRHWPLIAGYVRADQWMKAHDESQRQNALKSLQSILKVSARAVKKIPMHRCHYFVLESVVKCGKGQFQKALKLLEKAERDADFARSHWGLYEIFSQRSYIYKQQMDFPRMIQAAEAALRVAGREGWKTRIEKIRNEYLVGESKLHVHEESTAAAESKFRGDMEALLRVSLASASTLNPEEQAKAALDEVIRVLGAERAFLFRVNSNEAGQDIVMHAGRDQKGNDLTVLKGYSSTVVKKVCEEQKPLIVSGTEEGELIGSESAVINNLMSIIAAPLLVKNELLGAVYLDSRVSHGLFTKDHLAFLSGIVSHIAISIKLGAMAESEARRRELEKEMALAAAVQTYFLPNQIYYENEYFKLKGFYKAASTVSGDWWWYSQDAKGGISALIGDVTGHGAASAMLTASTAAQFRMLRKSHPDLPLGDLLKELNEEFTVISKAEYGMTMTVIQIEPDGLLRLWSAEAQPILILGLDADIKTLFIRGTSLGHSTFNTGYLEHRLQDGDRVFMYSDGVSELQVPGGRQVSYSFLKRMLKKTLNLDASTAINSIDEELKEASQDIPLADDLTFVIIDFKKN
jgi:serine/threonine protein kinase/serine phosphatase RsbU (regulator of sigma subunit)/tetratricopeptide (TPR) repeat protein